jgi:hypothetical protein
MGGKKIMALYVVSYYMVEFKGRPFKVYMWEALSIKSNCQMTSFISRIQYSKVYLWEALSIKSNYKMTSFASKIRHNAYDEESREMKRNCQQFYWRL